MPFVLALFYHPQLAAFGFTGHSLLATSTRLTGHWPLFSPLMRARATGRGCSLSPTSVNLRGPRRRCRAPSWVHHSPPGRGQHATKSYVFRFLQKFGGDFLTLCGQPGVQRGQFVGKKWRGSLKQHLDYLMSCSLSTATTFTAETVRTCPPPLRKSSPWRPGSAGVPCRGAERGVPSVARRPRPTTAWRHPGRAEPGRVSGYPGSRAPQRPPRRLEQVPEADARFSLSVEGPLPEQEGAPHTAGHAVIPAGHRSINQMRTRDRHGRISWEDPRKLTLRARRVNIAMPVLSLFLITNIH